jgi:hypothetical protein
MRNDYNNDELVENEKKRATELNKRLREEEESLTLQSIVSGIIIIIILALFSPSL